MKRATLIVLALIAAALLAPQQSPAQQKRALLVQVSEFKNPNGVPKIGELGEAQLDIPTIQAALGKYGFKQNVVVLHNNNASRQQVLAALDQIVQAAKPDDAIVFYFSGHGANTQNGDFSLCPWDALADSSRNDITEADLQQRLDQLNSRHVTNVTLILDCCFSKLGLRGLIPYRPKFIGRNETSPEPDLQRVHLSPDRAVLLAAAGQNGMALQIAPPNKPGWIGLFTLCLCNELGKAQSVPETTFRGLSDNIKRDVQLWINNQKLGAQFLQTPAIYGADALVDRPLFSAVAQPVANGGSQPIQPPPATPVKPYLLVTKADGGKISLNQGSSTGVVVGSEYALFPKDETQFTDKQRQIGSIKIAQVAADQATADLVEGDAGKIAPDCRATLTRVNTPIAKDGDLTIRVEGSAEFQTQMQQALQTLSYLTVVSDPKAAANIVLKQDRDQTGMTAQLLSSDGMTPLDANNPSYKGADDDDLVTQLTPVLDQLATLRTIAKLDNPNPAFKVEVKADKQQYAIGEDVSYTVTTDRDCYLFLIDVDPAGTPTLLLPHKPGEPNLLKAGAALQLPPQGIKYTVRNPTGKDTMIALTVTDPKVADEIKSRLFEILHPEKLPQRGSRGIGVEEVRADLQKLQLGPLNTWSISMLDILTLPKTEAGAPAGVGTR